MLTFFWLSFLLINFGNLVRWKSRDRLVGMSTLSCLVSMFWLSVQNWQCSEASVHLQEVVDGESGFIDDVMILTLF